MNFGSSNVGRGRGRGKVQNVPLDAWNPQRINHHAGRRFDRKKALPKEASAREKNYRVVGSGNVRNHEDEWKERENARECRLQKAKKIREEAAANFSHVLVDSDSSDEELRGEEILKKTMDNYKQHFLGMTSFT